MLTRLRSLYLSLVLCLVSHVCFAQWVAIPDNNFAMLLDTYYHSCMQGDNNVGWQMDTTCNDIVYEYDLYCANNSISSLEGIQYFDWLTNLDCSYNDLSVLSNLPNGLEKLICSYNQFTNLPTLPSNLWYLDCGDNQLTSLPVSPGNLSYLNCRQNQLATPPVLSAGLSYFNCSGNSLIALPPMPISLDTLICGDNLFTSLPSLPSGLTFLDCRIGSLYALPALPVGLTFLGCGSNFLSGLPVLPNGLTRLVCGNNNLSTLPALPGSITYLDCCLNGLTNLPSLPSNLTELRCFSNQLSSVPALPSGLVYLDCNSNWLNSIPQLPDSLGHFYCYNNTYLKCLPELKKIRLFNFSNTGINCLPNYPQSNVSSVPSLNSVPLCDVFNSNGCPVYWNIGGKVYNDVNSNCINDTSDTNVENVRLRLWSGSNLVREAITISNGHYSFATDTFGVYSITIDTSFTPFSVVCPLNNFIADTITALDSLHFNDNFGLRCKPDFDLEARSIATPTVFRPANFTQVNITAGDATNFYNVRCAPAINGAVTVTINGSAHYTAPANGALTPTLNGDTLTYTIADFGAVNFFTDFNIMVQTDTTAVLGSLVCITASVTPTAGDNNPANNTLTICFPVVASYDPNDKTAYPAGDIDTAQKEITYTVRFQNTGTAEAQHIYITDTLDTDIDEGSFQLLAYSHQPMVQIEQNRVRFNFPNINLPDSNTNEPLSHGYVQYKVKLNDNLPIGTTINNTAHIYFDFNAPVVTNTTSNTITTNTAVTSLSIQHSQFSIYPNPANTSFTVPVSETMIGEELTVTDITGKQMAAVTPVTRPSSLTISTETWSSGIYLVKVGNTVKKLIVQR